MTQFVEKPNSTNPMDIAEQVANEQAEAQATPTCKRCGTTESWGAASWCPVCGYYPQFDEEPEEIDHSLQGNVNCEEEATVENWWELVPQWGWILIGGVFLIIGISIAARLNYHFYGGRRGRWGAKQLLLGGLTTMIAHVWAGIITMKKDTTFAPADMIMRPITNWDRTVQGLPDTKIRAWMGAWGLTTFICAIVVVGGIRYSVIWEDWGFGESKTPDLMPVIAPGQKPGATKKSMDEVVNEMALINELPPPPEMPFVECVVFGYFQDPDGRNGFDQLLFAASMEGAPRHVASIDFKDVPEKDRRAMAVMLSERHIEYPYVDTTYAATWVEPSIVCKMRYAAILSNGRLTDPVMIEISKDLRKTKDFDKMNSKSDYTDVTECLDLKGFQKDYERKMKQWLDRRERAIIEIRRQTENARTTFEEVADELDELE